MGNTKLTISIMLKLLLVLCSFGYSIHVYAQMPLEPEASSVSRHIVEITRDKDMKCIQCHKEAKHSLHGSHGENVLKKRGSEINCTTCHGNIGPDHRENGSTVTKFHSAQSKTAPHKQHLSQQEILQANEQCVACHTPHDLQKANWTHDVHAKNLTCSNCHQVHAKKAKVLDMDATQKVKMCVDCHADFNPKKEQQE